MAMQLEKAKKVGRKFQNPVPTTVGGFTSIRKALGKMLRNKSQTMPKAPLGPFRTDVARYAEAPASGLRVTWFGHSSMLLEVDGVRLLVDPMWDERASPVNWLGPKRFFAPPLRLNELPELDAVLISHDHYDHLGRRTVEALAGARPDMQWVTSAGVAAVLEGFGVRGGNITELDWTETTVVRGLRLTAVPARHFSGRYAWNRFETLWSAFVLEGGRHRVYVGADTGLWPGFKAIGEQYGPFDLAMLEIGAFDELWADIHLGPDGAVQAFEELGARALMPVHWGLFNLALHGWRQPIERIWELASARGICLFQPGVGVPTEFVGGVDVRSDWWRG